jgi:pteridine reductase
VNLEGLRVLVAGGAHRVGREIALDLARAGAHVAISYHTSGDAAERTRADIAALGVRTAAIRADAAIPAEVEALVDGAATELGGLDAVVYCPSGGFVPTPPEAIDEALFDQAVLSTTKGFLFAAQAAHRRMRGVGGVIIAVNDVAAFQPWPMFAAHGAAKAAQAHLVKCLALAWGGAGVRVCGVAPGPVLMPDGVRGQGEETALGRIGDPADVAQAIRYLLEADFVTGSTLVVDGGRLLRP